jgi:hypothetical protein
MFYMFHTYIARVHSNVSSVFSLMLQQVFHAASVLSGCCICCSGYTHMLQVYVSSVSAILDVCRKCFIWILHMLQWLYTYVASLYFK